MGANDLVHRGEVAIEPAKHGARGLAGGDAGEVANVAEEHGGDALVALETDFIATEPDGARDFRIDVARKHLHQLLALLLGLGAQQVGFDILPGHAAGQRRRHAEKRLHVREPEMKRGKEDLRGGVNDGHEDRGQDESHPELNPREDPSGAEQQNKVDATLQPDWDFADGVAVKQGEMCIRDRR